MLVEPHVCQREGCAEVTSNVRFCSRSCAARVTNRTSPKRPKITPECFTCGTRYKTTIASHGFCSDECKMVAFKARLRTLLVKGSSAQTGWIKGALLRVGWLERECSRCGITEWQGEPAPLELDHVNGDNRDHRLENLRILCNNCHALTPTWRRHKKKQHDPR